MKGISKCPGLHKWNKEFRIHYYIVGMIWLFQDQ